MSLTVARFKSLNLSLLNSNKRFVIAFSGGLDSSVLLHLMKHCIASDQLLAWHVNHQLQIASSAMQESCQAQANTLNVSFKTSLLDLSHLKNNIEAQAREARYACFIEAMDASKEILLTAHHGDDQVETLLLNMLRGTGVTGLRGIASELNLGAIPCYRPLLHFSRLEIEQYAEQNQIKWFEDPSNKSQQFDRNFIRSQITPVLNSRWPALAESFTQVSLHQQEAYACLNELAQIDLEVCTSLKGDEIVSDKLSVIALRSLSTVRQKNLFKYWMNNHAIKVSQFQLNEMVDVLQRFTTEVKTIYFKKGFVSYFDGFVYWVKNTSIADEQKIKDWIDNHSGPNICRLNHQQYEVSSHFLKRQFQSRKIAPWLRNQTIFKLDNLVSKRVIEVITL